MTGMQLIIIDEESSPHGDMAKNDTLTGTEEHNNTSTRPHHHGEGVLSQDLRESFEAMKAVWRQAGRDRGEDAAATEELKRKEREQAIETALAVDSEVTKWQNGIAELKAMLAAAEEEDGSEGGYSEEGEEDLIEENNHAAYPRGRPLPAVRFPSLPPVVVPDDDENDDTAPSRNGAN
jgi:hypothetical protein